MFYKGVLTIVALTALSLAVELARSQSDHALNSVAAYVSKPDFDRTFAVLDTPSVTSLESVNTKREMLRREGMVRVNPAGVQGFVLLKTRIVDSHVALSLFDVDETLYTPDLDSPAVFVVSNRETPLINSEVDEVEPASAGSAALASVAFLFEPSSSSAAVPATFYGE